MGNIGAQELILIALVALLLFGGKRLADVGKGLGQGIKSFKQGLKETDEDNDKPAAKSEKSKKKDEPAEES
ncbi:MAG: twin-arginine translocase TatA/TatE family subunit [Polyangiaceae bacterium]|nr:twin-arginine translocase TatA/TatE family subunit [Polyangiaceae bacterium]